MGNSLHTGYAKILRNVHNLYSHTKFTMVTYPWITAKNRKFAVAVIYDFAAVQVDCPELRVLRRQLRSKV